jgi:hypothetical protein
VYFGLISNFDPSVCFLTFSYRDLVKLAIIMLSIYNLMAFSWSFSKHLHAVSNIHMNLSGFVGLLRQTLVEIFPKMHTLVSPRISFQINLFLAQQLRLN